MSQSVQEIIEAIDEDGHHVRVLLSQRHGVTNKDMLRLTQWLEAEGYLNEGSRKLTVIYRKDSKFTLDTQTHKVKLLLIGNLVAWPIIFAIVANLLFSR
jgi:hypothetical protein